MFDEKVCGSIGYYVYSLSNPVDGKIFYVGKGVKNRCFDHITDAIGGDKSTVKLDTIRLILENEKEVKMNIIRHGLNEETALEVEAALIDVLHLTEIGSNESRGHGVDRGLLSADEIAIRYGAKDLIPDENEALLLININKSYKPGMNIQEVYDAVRWCWPISLEHAKKANLVLAVAHGIVRGVFEPKDFMLVKDHEIKYPKDEGRVHFVGFAVGNSKYLNTSTRLFSGTRFPVRYVNC